VETGLDTAARVKIPILAELVPDGIGHGTSLLVEYDTHSQWFALATTIVARWLEAGNRALCPAMVRPREVIVRDLERLGVDVTAKEETGRLRVDDWYSATLTLEQLTPETEAIDGRYLKYGSVKIADLSVGFLKQLKGHRLLDKWSSEHEIGVLAVVESFSMLLRFNEERTFLEWFESRDLPLQRKLRRINLWGFGRGLHSEQFYKRLENMADGLIELRVMEREDRIRNFLRVTGVKGQPHDTRWHEIEVSSNGEAVLVT
jgi:KaiC/GvpD/RAD55 family RecA-like ATPase